MGAITGVVEVIFALSLASLLFPGDLSPYFAYGLGISLVTSVVILISTPLFSSVPGVYSSTQDTLTVILAVIVTTLAGTLASTSEVEKLDTILISVNHRFAAVTAEAIGFVLISREKVTKVATTKRSKIESVIY